MASSFQDLLETVGKTEDVDNLVIRETLGLMVSPALLVNPGLRVIKEHKVQEDLQAILEDPWKAIKARMVNRAPLVHKDQQKL